MKVYRVVWPVVDRLAEETGEHANLMIEEHGLGIFLYKAKGTDAVTLDTFPGMRVPLQTTSLGKAIMAHMPRSEVDRIIDKRGLPRVTKNTITDREKLYDQLEEVRNTGTPRTTRSGWRECAVLPRRSSVGPTRSWAQ